MPLIAISGYPTSGKTHRAEQLVQFFTSKINSSPDPRVKQITVHHINDQTLGLSHDVYKEAKLEKEARATEYSAVKRLLGPNAIVIADGLNYIKGFRYQLYCDAKSAKTTSCVIHVGTPSETCRQNNDGLLAKGEGAGYPSDIFENLVFRYEEPNGMNRWDSPLFTVAVDDETPPFEKIWDAVVGSDGQVRAVKPNVATVTTPATEADYLYELDKATQDIVNLVLDWQKNHPGEGGAEIRVGDEMVTTSSNVATLPQLQRIRRQFISLNRQNKTPKSRISTLFADYISHNLG